MKCPALWCGMVSLAYLVSGCSDALPAPDVVAKIATEEILWSEFQGFLAQNGVESEAALGSDVSSALFDQYLDECLLKRLASEELEVGIDLDQRAVTRLLIESSGPRPVDAAMIRAYYEQNIDAYERPERVYLRQMLFTEAQLAAQARDLWRATGSYDQVVETLGLVPGGQVGEAGEFSREDLPPPLAEVVFELETGEISQIVDADYGFHLFQVVERFGAGVASLPEVEAEIESELIRRQQAEVLRSLAEKAAERYNVRVFERNVPFNYVGKFRADATTQKS